MKKTDETNGRDELNAAEKARLARQRKEKEKKQKRADFFSGIGSFFGDVKYKIGDFFESLSDHPYAITFGIFALIGIVALILEVIGAVNYTTSMLNMQKIAFYISLGVVVALAVGIIIGLYHLDYVKWSSAGFIVSYVLQGVLELTLLVMGGITLFSGRLAVGSFYVSEEYGVVYAEKKNEYVVWKVLSGAETVVIESSYDGMLVREIKSSAVKNNADIRSVSFENGDFTIGNNAFKNCSGLTEITFGDNSVYTIGKTAFSNCLQLKVVTCGERSEYTVQKNAFKNCSSLETFNVGSSKITANTTQDINCDMQIFGGATRAIFYIDGGTVAYLADSVGGIVVGNNSRMEISAWYMSAGNSVSLSVGSAVFRDGFDFSGSTVSLALIKDIFIFGEQMMYYSVASEIYLPSSVTYIPDNFFGDNGDGCTVHYAGTEAQWDALSIGTEGNDNYTNGKVTVVCNSAYGD